MTQKYLVIGIGGVTCGGKTTLAQLLTKVFGENTKVFHQDDFHLLTNLTVICICRSTNLEGKMSDKKF